MTPDKRLNQLEPIVADVLQKVDRLIEGQGQLVELVTRSRAEIQDSKAEIQQVKATGEITATGLAKLTVVVHDLQTVVNDLRDEVQEGFNNVQEGFNTVSQRLDRHEQTQQEILSLLRERL